MRLLENASVSKLFSDSFEQKVLRSAYSYIHNLHDPLRCNSFAFAMRELIRIAMERLAPDPKIKKASWFVGYDKNGTREVTRKERYRFAVSGYLSNSVILSHPELDASTEIDALNNGIDDLSKYAHISKGTYDKSDNDVAIFKNKIEDAVIQYSESLEHAQKRIQDRVLNLTQDALISELINSIPNELDSISSQTIIERAVVEETQVIDLYHSSPVIGGSGYVEVELNYGSSSDDGASISDSYPLNFEATINPDTLKVTIKSLSIDTSSFYE